LFISDTKDESHEINGNAENSYIYINNVKLSIGTLPGKTILRPGFQIMI
jgi:hypothetical protein